MERRSTLTDLRHARQATISQSVEAGKRGDIAEKLEWEMRTRHIDRVTDTLYQRQRREVGGKSVFVSYGKRTGSAYFQMFARRLEQEGFVVRTGFEPVHGRDPGTVLGRILKQLRRSSLYCGILTKELRISDERETRWAPSVWTLEEKGMAVALGKPFHLLVDDEIHNDYWLKTAPERVHTLFNADNFLQRLEVAVKALTDRHVELGMRWMQSSP